MADGSGTNSKIVLEIDMSEQELQELKQKIEEMIQEQKLLRARLRLINFNSS